MEDSICTVFVTNKLYYSSFINTCSNLINIGKYKGDICLIIGDDLVNTNIMSDSFIINNKIIIKYFPDLEFTEYFMKLVKGMERPSYLITKIFQYHKLHLFNDYFKRWDYILYLDAGIIIFGDINPIIDSRKKNKLLAHSDAYPEYKWKLERMFDHDNQYYENMIKKYDLNVDYFQTTMMLYDTNIIVKETYNEIYSLLLEYPNCLRNDQSIIALYFICIKPCFAQIKTGNDKTMFYDYCIRDKSKKYIMIKRYI